MKHFIFSITILIFQNHFSQTFLVPLDNNFTKDSLILTESKRESSYMQNYSTFQGNVSPKLVYRVNENENPDLSIQYNFITENQIGNITYKWDNSFFNGNTLEKSNQIQQNNLINLYYKLIEELSQSYGKSLQEGTMDDLNRVNDIFGLYRTDKWESTNCSITAFIQLSNYLKQDINETVYPIFKIEVVFEYKSSKETNVSLATCNAIFNAFIEDIEDKNYNKARNYFSNQVINSISEDYLKKIRNQINYNKEFSLYNTSKQLMADGSENQILQYKYLKDNNENPLEFVSVVYDNSGKILGINPVNLGE